MNEHNLNSIRSSYLSPADPCTLLRGKHVDRKGQRYLEKTCSETERIFQLILTTDDYPFETQWDVRNTNRGDTIVASGDSYFDSRTTYKEVKCLAISQCYQFTIRDAYGDGLKSAGGFVGSFTVEYDDKIILEGGGKDFNDIMKSNGFGNACTSPTPSISLSPSELPTLSPTLKPSLSISPSSSNTTTKLDWEVLVMALLFFPIAAVACCIIVRSQITRNYPNNDQNPSNNATQKEVRRTLIMTNVIVDHWKQQCNSSSKLEGGDEEKNDEGTCRACNSPGRNSLRNLDGENEDFILGQTSKDNPVVSSLRSSITFLKNIGASSSTRRANSILYDDCCTICLEPYNDNDQICRSRNKQCSHLFHLDCMVNWLLHHDECPICRAAYLDNSEESDQQKESE